MVHDVFISYSHKDKNASNSICSIMERNGISCWIAPRDITPGVPFAEAIIDAIKDSKVFVLVYSSNTNQSQQVIREVDRAVHHGLAIIPLRLEDVPMSKQLEYYVSNVHWLDALTPPLEKHINTLCHVVQRLLTIEKIDRNDIRDALSAETMKQTSFETVREDGRKKVTKKPFKSLKRRWLFVTSIAALLLIVKIIANPKIFKRDTLENLRTKGGISVAVMPFQNLTNDTVWDIWESGIQDEFITMLTFSNELKVRQKETTNTLLKSKGLTNYASIAPNVASMISKKLDADVFIHGSIKQAYETIRLNVQLINSSTEEIYKSFQIEGKSDNILHLTDSLSDMVRNCLIITNLIQKLPTIEQRLPPTNSSEAFKYYLLGENARSKREYPAARKLFSQALAIDSNFHIINLLLSAACINEGLYEEAKEWSIKAYAKRDQMSPRAKILTEKNHASFFGTPYEELKYLRQYLEIDDQFPGTYYDIGLIYYTMYQYDKSIPEFEKALELYDKMDSKPCWIFNYSLLSYAYHATGQYKKEKKLFKKADRDFPDDPAMIWQKTLLSLTEGDTVSANNLIKKYKTLRKERSWSDAGIAYSIGEIYKEAGYMDKAEEYHRMEVALEPNNPDRLWDLGWFLIDKDRNIEEGLSLVDKALELKPDFYWYLDAKGWGLYKQGKFDEALKYLEKCIDLSPSYRHNVYLHLEAAKKAVTNEKNN
jgi:tetratricopeptide (TPR) repeat protein